MRIIVMAGTSDAVRIMEIISKLKDMKVIATTTTKYGGEIALSSGADEVLVGALGIEEIVELLKQKQIDLLVDATHPFASEATKNAIKAAEIVNIPYMRFERASVKLEPYEKLFCASNFDEAAEIVSDLIEDLEDGKIMHLAGVSTIPQLTKKIPASSIVVRVLPAVYSIKKCLEFGIPSENIIAMQGTFSEEFNRSIMREYDVKLILTKESGETGGTPSKIEAAHNLKIPVVLITRPEIPELQNKMVFTDIQDLIDHLKLLK